MKADIIRNAWNRWGEADEAGALNYVGHEQVLQAANLVRAGKIVSLAQPIFPGMAMPSHRAGMSHFMGRDGGDYAAGARSPGGFQFAEDTVVMPLHIGTHVDALCHCWYDDKLFNGHPASGIRSTKGAERCGVETMPPVVTRGVLLDFVALTGSRLADGQAIDLDLLRQALAATGVELQIGDVVLLRTGWLESQSAPSTVSFDTEPGIDVSAAQYLVDCGVAMIGADNFAVEVLPFAPGTVFPVHQLVIRDFGVPLLEGLVLDRLAVEGRSTFAFIAAPIPFKGGTGSPLNPLAVL